MTVAFLTKAEQQTGAMVALYPPREVAEAIAQPGGEPAEELHLTLAFLGAAVDLGNVEALATVVAGCAASLPPLTGEIAGIGHFTAGPEPVTYVSPDVPGLPEFRQCVCEAITGAGFRPSTDHGFTPHITLAYDHTEPQVPNLALAFNALSLVVAGERLDFPLIGKKAHDRSDMPSLKTLFQKRADAGSAAAPSKATKTEKVDKAFTTELWKDDAAQIVYGVVMQPDVADSQGDIVTAAEIEQAAHRYLAESRLQDVQHSEEAAGAVPVESFIAPSDMEYHGRPVLKGSWVMASHVADADIWQQIVKGELTGYSIGGTAERVDAA